VWGSPKRSRDRLAPRSYGALISSPAMSSRPSFGISSASSPSQASRASAPAAVVVTVVTVLALTACTKSGKIAGNPAENTGWSGGSRR